MAEQPITRKALIDRLNEDLAREYQAIIAYVVYSQVLKGAQYMNIAKELEVHAGEELAHAITIAKHFEGTDAAKPENLPLVANALVVNAQKLAANEGADWSDPTAAAKYLEIMLAMFARATE